MASDTIPGRMVEDKVVVVIGAGGLLGRDFVRGIAEHGGHPVLADIVEPQTSEHLAMGVDINSKASVTALISAVHARYGRIDAVVNSAYPRNAQYGRKFFDVTHEDFCENISLNLGGMFWYARKWPNTSNSKVMGTSSTSHRFMALPHPNLKFTKIRR